MRSLAYRTVVGSTGNVVRVMTWREGEDICYRFIVNGKVIAEGKVDVEEEDGW